MTSDVTSPSFKERRGGLIFFGVLQLVLGILAVLTAAMTALSLLIRPPAGAPPAPIQPRVLVPIIVLYLVIAVWFIVLGIASMLPRRWAWALTLVQSWIWLVFGVMTVGIMLLQGNHFMPALPPGQEGIGRFVLGCMAAVFAILFVVLPVAFVLFYRSPNVKATVWNRDREERWTDRIPLPVLGGGLVLIASAVMVLTMSGTYKGLPIGNTIIAGPGALAILVAFAAISAFSGVQLLRLRRSGWWGTAVFILIGVVFGLSLLATDSASWRAVLAIDVPREEFDRIAGMYRSPLFFAWMAIVWCGYAGFLVYIRRYFFPGTTSSELR